jgi:hypothetical protein
MLGMLHTFIEIINDLELSSRPIILNNFSIPEDKSVDPQKDTLCDSLLLLLSLSSYTISFFLLSIFV